MLNILYFAFIHRLLLHIKISAVMTQGPIYRNCNVLSKQICLQIIMFVHSYLLSCVEYVLTNSIENC